VTEPEAPRASATWLGHATVLLESDGARLLTDPVLVRRLGHLVRHAPAPALPQDLDAILLSHAHRDHLDRRTLRAIDPSVPIVVPEGIDPVVRRLGREVIELPPEGTLKIGGTTVRAAPVDHDPRRAPWSMAAGAATGYVVGERLPIWFPGDTDLHPRLGELAGHISLALLPVWGWGPSLGPGHLDPERAARAAAVLRPRVAMPIHWGTYLPSGLGRTHGHLLRTPPQEFVRHMVVQAPTVRIGSVGVGGRVELGPADAPPGAISEP
jgi:L-ascorbate metabolism protein UlaG (beta-lactamase superfamily)